MLLTRAVVSTNRCGVCHLTLLKSFTSLAGAPLDLQSLHPAAQQRTVSTRRVGQPRSLSSAALLRTSKKISVGHGDGVVEDEAERSAEGANTIYPSVTSAAPIPWYLQIDTPQAPVYPVSDRQRLPDMPVDPPPVLEPLLKYISLDLGLDDLSLFDLRKLDPPPALGSKLLMILGTARSERHLHVSADRLCCWLRSTYRLTPFADGLLGRNELKLKMRRKARRAKLLGTVGTSASSTADDGVRTGWVCVNVGTVEGGKASQEDTVAMPEIVGFGSRSTGVNVVIQMLTEEKRGELDLEELWGGMLKGQIQSPGVAVDDAQETPNNSEFRLAIQVRSPTNSDSPCVPASCHPRSNQSSWTQIRALHSKRQLSAYNGHDDNLDQSSGQDSTSIGTMLGPMVDDENPSSAAALSVSETEDHNLVRGEFRAWHNSPDSYSIPAHFRYLKSLPRDAALKALGQDINDTSSTSFLKSFYAKLSVTGNVSQWKYKLELLSYGMKLGHEGYPKSFLTQILQQMQGSSAASSLGVLINMLNFTTFPNERGIAIKPMSPADLTTSMKILDELSRCGCRTLPMHLFVVLQRAAYYMAPLRGSAEGKSAEGDAIRDSRNPTTMQERLSTLLDGFTAQRISEADYGRMLQRLAQSGRWEQFWRLWRTLPKGRCRRSEALYATMFRAVANEKQDRCVQCLRVWVPAMGMEKPPVKLEGEVAKAVMDCLKVVKPNVEKDTRKGLDATSEWVSLWVRCQLGLRARLGQS